MQTIPIGILGCGYWGPNLIRNFVSCPLTEVVAVHDADPARMAALGRSYPHLEQAHSLDEFLDRPLQAVAVATPVSTHFSLVSRCLEAGRHVLVEKPLAATVREAQALVELAAKHQRILMVDHTYLFSSAIQQIQQRIEQGELGDLYYVDSVRINLGLFRHDSNVIWDLAPHDLAIVDQVLGLPARSISAWGCAHADPDIEDIAYVNVDFGDRLLANFHINWLSPVKVRQMIFAGSRKSLVFNELNVSEPIKLYDCGIELGEAVEQRHRLLINYRSGDVWSPHVEPGEALQAVVTHFADCIQRGEPPRSDGAQGLRVVRLLEAATRSIRAQGGRVVLSQGNSGNGVNDAHRPADWPVCPNLPRRNNGTERDHPWVRELIRLPNRG